MIKSPLFLLLIFFVPFITNGQVYESLNQEEKAVFIHTKTEVKAEKYEQTPSDYMRYDEIKTAELVEIRLKAENEYQTQLNAIENRVLFAKSEQSSVVIQNQNITLISLMVIGIIFIALVLLFRKQSIERGKLLLEISAQSEKLKTLYKSRSI